ncbi:MAG: isochorismatase family protein [Acidobacteriaceae bacterium]|nr:isochorismatase family protein [Acidobacteriaceae bacterium]
MLTPEETAFILIDHQAGLMLYPHDLDPLTLRSNSIALAKTAKLFQCPVIMTAADQGPKGPIGPILPEITNLFPDVQPIYRTKINSWHEPAIKKAIEATGRKKLVFAGITSDFCSGLPAKSAAAAGYYSYLVMDASGNLDTISMQCSLANLTQAGVKVTNWLTIATELLADWQNPQAQGILDIYREHLPNWSMLSVIEEAKPKQGGN